MSVNILKKAVRPSRMWIDGKCFNVRPFKPFFAIESPDNKTETTAEETLDNGFNIAADENGKLCTSFRLPNLYYKELVNRKIDALESATNTKICVPASAAEGSLTISGEDAGKIAEARHQIHSLLNKIRNSQRPLQFISIPTVSDEIQANFERFKREILSGAPIEGMEESVFQKGLKLHLTVSVFSLFDENEVEEAKKTLQDYREKILNDFVKNAGPLKILVAGLNCMDKNPAKVNVLYANARIVEEKNGVTLQKIVDDVANHFYERGFVKNPQEMVKLHCTLINTKYRKSLESPEKKRKWQKRQTFDGRRILQNYKDYYFGVCNFDAVHLSLMSAVGDDGFYKALDVLKFGD